MIYIEENFGEKLPFHVKPALCFDVPVLGNLLTCQRKRLAAKTKT